MSERVRRVSRLLIANRSEIALRIARAARAEGLQTIAIVAEDDAGAIHPSMMDWCVRLPHGAGYLDIDAVMAAARCAGADALHPGYGFLAENPALAQACEDAGLVFIGPAAETIRLMGDKARARQAMVRAGLPVIAGYDGENQDPGHLARQAAIVGYPLMIKARAGGGGRGLRRVDSAAEFDAALAAARAEGRVAFGDDSVLIERAIDGARHVEFQILADRYGKVIHLGERDCSVQRRHQKLIEEAPAPGVEPSTRERIGALVVRALASIGYLGAGTVEMLLAPDGTWMFMEMNTRLQVEHPVTEAITGEDLVRWQLRVAAGEPIPDALGGAAPDGHAIEVRLCAEQVAAGFLPDSGTVLRWEMPEGIRVEHALADGVSVSPRYDSMIAKLVAHGRDREHARQRLKRALGELVVLGVSTNRDFLLRCLDHPDFVAGRCDTGFVAGHLRDLCGGAEDDDLALVAAGACLLTPGADGLPGSPKICTPQPLGHRYEIPMRLRIDDGMQEVRVCRTGADTFAVTVGQHRTEIGLQSAGEGAVRLLHAAHAGVVRFARTGAVLWLASASRTIRIEDRTFAAPVAGSTSATGDRTHRAPAGGVPGQICAPTTARVASLQVAVGDRVNEGAWLLSLEAMKIEHRVVAPAAAWIAAVHVSSGTLVRAGQVLLDLDLPGPG